MIHSRGAVRGGRGRGPASSSATVTPSVAGAAEPAVVTGRTVQRADGGPSGTAVKAWTVCRDPGYGYRSILTTRFMGRRRQPSPYGCSCRAAGKCCWCPKAMARLCVAYRLLLYQPYPYGPSLFPGSRTRAYRSETIVVFSRSIYIYEYIILLYLIFGKSIAHSGEI